MQPLQFNQNRLRIAWCFLIPLLCAYAFVAFMSSARAQGSITVNDAADLSDIAPGDGQCATSAGTCTLRAAIEEANASNTLDTITFNLPLPATILLTNSLNITSGLTINGPETGQLTLDAGNNTRHFTIDSPNNPVNISNLTLINGRAENGGAIFFSGPDFCCSNSIIDQSFSFNSLVIRGSRAVNSGGAIYLDGVNSYTTVNFTINITNVQFQENRASNDGGALYIENSADSSINIVDSIFSSNQITASTFDDSSGGALFMRNFGGNPVNITDSIFSSNQVTDSITTTIELYFLVKA